MYMSGALEALLAVLYILFIWKRKAVIVSCEDDSLNNYDDVGETFDDICEGLDFMSFYHPMR